jgi:hypothetical protein
MEFIDGRGAERRIRNLLKSATTVRAAVAYWGAGAVARLGLNDLGAQDVRIYCDVRSGGCDVTEIRLLQKYLGKKSIRTCDTLHAKAWLTDSAGVLGSSNASTNGYGVEGEDASKLLEANVYLEDRKVMRHLADWIDNEVEPTSREITDNDLVEGDKNRPDRIGSAVSKLTVLDQLAENPAAYRGRNVFVWIWPFEEMTAKEERAVEAEGKSRGVTNINAWIGVTRADIAQLRPGSLVLEFDSSSSPPRFEAVFRVLTDSPVCRIEGQTSILCSDVGGVFGAPIGKRRHWRDAAQRAVSDRPKSTLSGSLHEFASDFLIQ